MDEAATVCQLWLWDMVLVLGTIESFKDAWVPVFDCGLGVDSKLRVRNVSFIQIH